MTLLTNDEIITVFERFKAQNPEPKPELNYYSPFTLLVAVVLSAQTTDKSVNKVTEILFKRADTPESFISSSRVEGTTPLNSSQSILLKPRIFFDFA